MKQWDNIIKELKEESNSLSYTLNEIIAIANKEGRTELSDYALLELDGYAGKTEIMPNYRKFPSEIIIDYATPYGHMMNNFPLDVSSFGSEVSELYFTLGIIDIESTLKSMNNEDKSCESPLHPGQFKIIKNLVADTNNGVQVLKARYRFPKNLINSLLSRVRMNLLLKIQALKNDAAIEVPTSENFTKLQEQPISVFVSYAWESDEYQEKVISFVDFLRQKGYNATMDQKQSQEASCIDLNQMMIEGIKNNDKVIIVLSEKYKNKADNNDGGVGNEFSMIMGDIKSNPKKYILVSSMPLNSEQLKLILPFAIPTREVIDLKMDQDERNFAHLFSKLEEQNLIEFHEVVEKGENIIPQIPKPFKL